MRLLNTTTLELESFIDPLNDAPAYAILSHMWEADEVLFEDMATPERRLKAPEKQGWAKVRKSCEVARDKRFAYIWIDTLCIDKSSSAELSEAINSMFAWYAYSGFCLAYLADFAAATAADDGPPKSKGATVAAAAAAAKAFRDSRWFTRAWTLQELIAPAHLVFYDAEWRQVGDRRSLSDVISARGSIYPSTLERKILAPAQNLEELKRHLRTVCIGVKMNWAAQRQATRDEDLAYSLLGVFDVNMALLYGEGRQKAFLRLQEQIIKHGFDHSLLSWQSPDGKLPHLGRWDWVLAPQPELFVASRNLTHLRGQHRLDTGTLYPDGLRLDGVMVCPVEAIKQADVLKTGLGYARTFLADHPDSIELTRAGDVCAYLAVLRCSLRGNYSKRVGILVFRDRNQPDRYYRAHESAFVVEVGDDYIALGDQIKLGIDLGKSESQRIMLSSPPTVSWQTKSGAWPCAYNWAAEEAGWRFKEYIECRKTKRGVLKPPLPSWLPDRSDVKMSHTASPDRYKVNGMLLFEKVGTSAFLVLWGSAPESAGRAPGVKSSREGSVSEVGGQREAAWWKSEGGYFCCVVDWETFFQGPYRSADLNRVWRDYDLQGSPFNSLLILLCLKTITAQSPKASVTADIGSRTRVEASIKNDDFLGVDGIVVKVSIGRRDSLVPPAELHKRVASQLKLG